MTIHKYNARGIYFFPGTVGCPFAGIGTRGDHDSNRLVLDSSDTEVTIDRAAHTITVRDDKAYKEKTTVADLMFLSTGYSASGEALPFSVHLKVQKQGHKYSVDLHRHLRNQTKMVRADYEAYTVTAFDGGRATVVLDKARTDELITEPSFALRVVKALMAMKDHTEGLEQDPAQVGYRVVDLSVGFGALGLEYMMARAQLVSLDKANAPLIERGSVPEMLREGAWEMKLTALSEKWLPEVVMRDIFLYGLDELPLLAEVKKRGLKKNQTLSFKFSKGEGSASLSTPGGAAADNGSVPLPNALDVARAYMEFHMLGGLIAEQAESGSRRPRSAPAGTRDRAGLADRP
jgi:hypothetical protein